MRAVGFVFLRGDVACSNAVRRYGARYRLSNNGRVSVAYWKEPEGVPTEAELRSAKYWLPSPAEIEAAKAEIRAGWTETQEMSRRAIGKPVQWEVGEHTIAESDE